MSDDEGESGQRCAWCDGSLPALIEQLAVVHGHDDELMTTCSTACLAELVSSLAGRPAQDRRYAEGVRN